MRSLDGKVVVITGAGSGIGRALALRAADQGAVLALSDVDASGLAETASQVRARTFQAVRADVLDVRDRSAVRAYAGEVHADLGRVNVVVNNAGIAFHGEVEEMSYEDLEQVMAVDFWGVVHGTKEFLPHLIASGDGHVVNVSSVFGLMSAPGQSAYNAAKAAVRGFTEALCQEMLVAGHPVRVTCVHPGGIRTSIVRNARVSASHDHDELAARFDARVARMDADRAAEIILDGVLADRARVLVGADAKVVDWGVRLVGARYQRVVALLTRRQNRQAR